MTSCLDYIMAPNFSMTLHLTISDLSEISQVSHRIYFIQVTLRLALILPPTATNLILDLPLDPFPSLRIPLTHHVPNNLLLRPSRPPIVPH